MLDDEDLQEDVARVRDRAREMRRDFNRTGKGPEWGLMEEDIMTPLSDLKERLEEEISKREKPDSRLPLDRDPVPGPFEDLVREYYERLGSGE
ncbi:MAG: hypothetical protein VCA35_15510 [Roseibacillus sp.]